MNKRYGSILIVSVTILVLCFVAAASATNWFVDGSGGDADFTGIQDAINNATDGDTILVHSGLYYENVVVDRSVTLKGIGHPVVDAGGEGREGSAITLTADGTTLEGFTATNAESSWQDKDAGIKVISNNNTITGNNVCNNSEDGISLYDSCDNTITGNNACNNDWGGIRLDDSCNNNNITSNNVSSNGFGIGLGDSSNNNKITGNNVRNNNGNGISLDDSSNNNTITGNTFVNDGLSVSSSYQNTVEDNTVNDKPLVYLEDVSDCKVEDAGQVIVVNCNNITIENLDLSNTIRGIALWKTENSKISNNTVCNNRGGIGLSYSSNNNTITGNNVSSNNNFFGISLDDSSNNNTITGNNVSNNNGNGIRLSSSSNNSIKGNNVSNNDWGGIGLGDSSNNNKITGNNVRNNNNNGGIRLSDSSNNKIYLNNFMDNSYNVYYYGSTPNIWNSPLEIIYTYNGTTYKSYVGNYWGDYEGTDAEGDGIGDTSYSIDSDSNESDDYPLMTPFENYILTTSAPA